MRAYTTSLMDAESVVHAMLIEVHTASGVIRRNTSDDDLEWNSETWVGDGGALAVKSAEEDMSGEIHGAIVTLAGLDPATTSLALSETLEGKLAVIYHCLFDPDTLQIAEVQKTFSGRVSNVILTKASSNGG